MTTSKVLFFTVRDSQSKLQILCKIAQQHFEKKEPLQIIVPDKQALEFVDSLLWRSPEESFLPHCATSIPCSDLLVVTTERTILNQAQAIFNLCPAPPLNCKVKTIYDLDDRTSPDKKQASDKRYHAYRDALFHIIEPSSASQ